MPSIILPSSNILMLSVGHFIAEHYVFEEGHETYSYYGSLNKVTWNVGYHNEHHDFPRVPGWKLPMVKAMAPEFYDCLPSHSSWTYALWRYATDPNLGPFSRVRRNKKDPMYQGKTVLATNTSNNSFSSKND